MRFVRQRLLVMMVATQAALVFRFAALARQPLPDGSFIRVTVVASASPFSEAAYDLTLRGDALVVTLAKQSPCVIGQRQALSLVEGKRALSILDWLQDAGAFDLETPEGAREGSFTEEREDVLRDPRAVVYEFWCGRGRRLKRFWLTEEKLLQVPALVRLFRYVRSVVLDEAGSLPMRDVYYPPERLGYLTMSATEEAVAIIDGWDRMRLPVDDVPIVEGEHRVVVRGESGAVREFTVRIVRGATTRVHVVLK